MDEPTLKLITLTRLWLFARQLHNVGRISLWSPISHRTLFWVTVIFGPWTLILGIVGLPWAGPGLSLHVLLPGLACWWVINMVDGGARPDELLRSWISYGLACRLPRRKRRLTSTVRTVR